MAESEQLSSKAKWLTFFSIEALLAGGLWLIGLIHPILLIPLGIIGLVSLALWKSGRIRWMYCSILAGILLIAASGTMKYYKLVNTKPSKSAVVAPTPTSAPPAIRDVQIQLVPEALKGSDLDAHFVFRNRSSQPVTISLISYHIPAVFSSAQIGEVQVPIGAERNWPINGKRLLEVKRVHLEFAYKFEKLNPKTNGAATFNIPTNVKPGHEIAPSECCEAPKIDFAEKRHKQLSFELNNRPDGEISLGKIPEKDPDGRPVTLFLGDGSRRQLVVNMAQREIVFLVNQNGNQQVFVSKVNPTIDNLHSISVFWNDKNKEAGLKVDGVFAPTIEDLQRE